MKKRTKVYREGRGRQLYPHEFNDIDMAAFNVFEKIKKEGHFYDFVICNDHKSKNRIHVFFCNVSGATFALGGIEIDSRIFEKDQETAAQEVYLILHRASMRAIHG